MRRNWWVFRGVGWFWEGFARKVGRSGDHWYLHIYPRVAPPILRSRSCHSVRLLRKIVGVAWQQEESVRPTQERREKPLVATLHRRFSESTESDSKHHSGKSAVPPSLKCVDTNGRETAPQQWLDRRASLSRWLRSSPGDTPLDFCSIGIQNGGRSTVRTVASDFATNWARTHALAGKQPLAPGVKRTMWIPRPNRQMVRFTHPT